MGATMRELTPVRVGMLIGGGGLLAAWLAAAASAPGAAPADEQVPAQSRVAAEDPLVTEMRLQADRLRTYLERVPPSPEPARNPFEFATPDGPSAPAERAVRETAVDEPGPVPGAVAAPASTPTLRLIGVAERRADGGAVRTAIFSGPTNTYLVEAGDEIAGQFRVIAVAPESVELLRLDDQATFTLVLP